MIREQLAIDEMRPADAYALGFQDAADSYDHDGRHQASKAHRDLDAILDRLNTIEPLPHLDVTPVFDGEAE